MSFEKINPDENKRPAGRNAILCYGFEGDDFNRVVQHTKAIGIDEVIYIGQKSGDTTRKILEVLEDKGNKKPSMLVVSKSLPAMDRAIIFNAVSQDELHRFVGQFNMLGMEKPLFAMVTPVSVFWNIEQLLIELKSEREELKRQ